MFVEENPDRKKKKKISRSNDNQTMKFGFLKNYTQNMMIKLFPDTFPKNQNLWVNTLRLTQFVFIVCQIEGY